MAWNQLPSEIFNIILQDADLETMKNVRLVNKVTAQRCLPPRFLSCASHVRTDLTEKSLWKLIERASHPAFSRAVHYLTILAVCYDHRGKHVLFDMHLGTRGYWNPLTWMRRKNPVYTPRATYNLEWLQQQQTIRDDVSDQFIIQVITSALDSFMKLKQINLQARVMTSPNEMWSPYAVLAPVILPWASRVCYLVLAAVAKSESTVPKINIYAAYEQDSKPARWCSPHEVHCGVSIGELSHFIDKINDGGEVRLPFECMGICLSTRRQTQIEQGPGWLQTGYSSLLSVFSGSVAGESPSDDSPSDDLSGLMRLFKATPCLGGLRIKLDHEDLATRNEFHGIFTSVANQVSLRQLKVCRLIRLPVTPAALLRFLETHRDLTNLTLKGLSIPSDGSWDPIFRFIGAEMMDLNVCIIDHLYHGDARIPLDRDNFLKDYFPRRLYLPVESANNGGPDIYLIFLPPGMQKRT